MKRLRRTNLVEVWCPRVKRLNVPSHSGKIAAYRDFLVAGVILTTLLGVIIGSYLIWSSYYEARYGNSLPRFERIEVVYVAANQTSREIFCKLRNTGNVRVTLEETRINGKEVDTGDHLATIMEPFLDYKTVVLKYDGVWQQPVEIIFRTAAGNEHRKTVDLQEASQNPIEGAYPSVAELQAVNSERSERHVADTAINVYSGSIAIFIVAIVIMIVLLVLRSRRKVESHPIRSFPAL